MKVLGEVTTAKRSFGFWLNGKMVENTSLQAAIREYCATRSQPFLFRFFVKEGDGEWEILTEIKE